MFDAIMIFILDVIDLNKGNNRYFRLTVDNENF